MKPRSNATAGQLLGSWLPTTRLTKAPRVKRAVALGQALESPLAVAGEAPLTQNSFCPAPLVSVKRPTSLLLQPSRHACQSHLQDCPANLPPEVSWGASLL